MPHQPLPCPPMTRPLPLPHPPLPHPPLPHPPPPRLPLPRPPPSRPPPPRRHRPIAHVPLYPDSATRHSATATGPLVTPRPPQPRPPPRPPPKTPTRSPSTPALKPHRYEMARGLLQPPCARPAARAHLGWFDGSPPFTSSCVALPSTNPTKSVPKQYNKHIKTKQQPYKNAQPTVKQPNRKTVQNRYNNPAKTPIQNAQGPQGRCENLIPPYPFPTSKHG